MDNYETQKMKDRIDTLEHEAARLRKYKRWLGFIAICFSLVVSVFLYETFIQEEARAMGRDLTEVRSSTDGLADRVTALESRSIALENQLNQFIVSGLEERDKIKQTFENHKKVIEYYHANAFSKALMQKQPYTFPEFVDPRGVRALDYFRGKLPPRDPNIFSPIRRQMSTSKIIPKKQLRVLPTPTFSKKDKGILMKSLNSIGANTRYRTPAGRLKKEIIAADRTIKTAQKMLVRKGKVDRRALSSTIKKLERHQKSLRGQHENLMESVRNKRTKNLTAFQNFDQKSNQLFNILASVLKATKEMQAGVARNFL